MRVLHTSDWHLGQELYGFNREVEHDDFFAWLAQQISDEKVDALIVSGDIFDSVNPPITAQRRLYRFLDTILRENPDLNVVITGGNHDSASRVELPAPLLNEDRVTLVGGMPRLEGKLAPAKVLVPLKNKEGVVSLVCAAVPYLRPGDLPIADTGESAIKSLYDQVIKTAEQDWSGLPLIVMGHLHVQGASISELSERRIIVGNEEAIPSEIFSSSIDYVALGHLHRPQTIGEKLHVRYSGAPFPMSTPERDYCHSVVLVDFDTKGVSKIQSIDIPRPIEFIRIPDESSLSLDDLEEQLLSISLEDPGVARRPFLEVAVKLVTSEPEMRSRIEAALDGKPVRLTRIIRDFGGVGRSLADAVAKHVSLGELTPDDVFIRRHEEIYGEAPPEDLLNAFNEILAEVSNPQDESYEGTSS